MANNANRNLAIQIALAALLGNGTPQQPGLIQEAENAIGTGNGQAKHDLVISGLNTIVTGVAAGAAQNNPQTAAEFAPLASPLLGFFSTLISKIVDGRKAIGVPFTPQPAAAPVSAATGAGSTPAPEGSPV